MDNPLHGQSRPSFGQLRTSDRQLPPDIERERFFTDKEVSARLKVSRRTLQDYRNEGRIAYIQLGGKILYRESDIERMLAATAPLTDRRQPDFLEGAQFAVCPVIASAMDFRQKEKGTAYRRSVKILLRL